MKIHEKFLVGAAIALGMLAGSLLADAQTPQAPKAPVISDALKYKWAKSQIQLQAAQNAYQRAQQASMEASNEITKACGDGYLPQMDAQGDPVCVVKPAPKAEAQPGTPKPTPKPAYPAGGGQPK